MSSIASFYRISRNDLGTGPIADLLHHVTDLGRDYAWSGYVMLNLLVTLEESGVRLGGDIADGTEPDQEAGAVFFATSGDLDAIESLDISRLDEESLGDGLDIDNTELREAVAESVATLRQLIAGTQPHEVLVIKIG